MVQIAARFALVVFVCWAAVSVLEPNHDANRLQVAADALEHGLMTFGLVVLGAAAFRRISLLWIGGLVLILGGSLEALQHLKLIGGQGQVRDLLADLAGVAIALFAVSAGETRVDPAEARPDS